MTFPDAYDYYAGTDYLPNGDATGELVSIRDWVVSGDGVLFIPYRAGEIAALRQLISTWVRTGIFQAMDGFELGQKMWFVVDELDGLGPIDGLKDALARLRKFGGRCVLGFQSKDWNPSECMSYANHSKLGSVGNRTMSRSCRVESPQPVRTGSSGQMIVSR